MIGEMDEGSGGGGDVDLGVGVWGFEESSFAPGEETGGVPGLGEECGFCGVVWSAGQDGEADFFEAEAAEAGVAGDDE